MRRRLTEREVAEIDGAPVATDETRLRETAVLDASHPRVQMRPYASDAVDKIVVVVVDRQTQDACD
jgi:hypothetical protein